jgi:predicted dithiol-disulfide oxidoreductase (DUF899 family)
MTGHIVVSREEWTDARTKLLLEEKDLTRRSDEVARHRRELPWVQIEKEYRFDTENGNASLADLFCGRSQLLVYHFMFGLDYAAGCPHCTAIADGFNPIAVHLANHDVMLWAVSRAPLEKLMAYRQRLGWTFSWASSFKSDFNYDFNVAFTEEQQKSGNAVYNYRSSGFSAKAAAEAPKMESEIAATAGTDWATFTREAPGMSAFKLEDGVVYHTYSAYARGLDGLWSIYQWLDRAPLGRNESGFWMRRHDEYDAHPEDAGSCCRTS